MFWDILSTFVSTAGAWQEATSSARAYSFNANIAKYNANQSRQTGAIEEARVRRAGRAAAGQMRANIGASGIDGGSAEDLLGYSMYSAEMDALTTRYNYNAQATGFDMQASMYGAASSDAKKGGFLNASAALLKGGTSLYKHNTDYGAGETPFKLGGGSGKTTMLSNGDSITWDN